MSERLDKKAQRALEKEAAYSAKAKHTARGASAEPLSKKALKAQLLAAETAALERSSNRMRCCEDVIGRLKHESHIDLSAFTIGHYDRILNAVQQTPFTTFFSHSDYADIPLHRVRYVQYYDFTIWHREQRCDVVYGSAGVPVSAPRYRIEWPLGELDFESLPKQLNNLHDVLAYTPILAHRQSIRLQREEQARKAEEAKKQSAVKRAQQARKDVAMRQQEEKEQEWEEREQESDEEWETVEADEESKTGTTTVQSSETVSVSTPSASITATNTLTLKRSKAQPRTPVRRRSTTRPNFFVSLRITDPSLLHNVHTVQQHLTEHNAHLSQCAIAPYETHVTLCLLTLTNNAEKALASKVLAGLFSQLSALVCSAANAADDILEPAAPATISFTGLSTFDSQVLYAKPDQASAELFQSIHATLHKAFASVGLHVCEMDQGYTAHLTVAKLSKLQQQLRKQQRQQHRTQHHHHSHRSAHRTKSNKRDKHYADDDFSVNSRSNGREQKRDRTRHKDVRARERDAKQRLQTEYESVQFMQESKEEDSEFELSEDSEQDVASDASDDTATEAPVPTAIAPAWYAAHHTRAFGSQPLTQLELCSMRDREADGSYRVLQHVQLLSAEQTV